MRLSLALALAVAATVSPPAVDVAHACRTSCQPPSAVGAARAASVAFVGTITKTIVTESCDLKHPAWCVRTYSYEVAVEGVWKGKVGTTVTVDAGTNRGDCSLGSLGKSVENQRWLFFSRTTPVKLRVCGGSRRATAKDVAAISASLGAPTAP